MPSIHLTTQLKSRRVTQSIKWTSFEREKRERWKREAKTHLLIIKATLISFPNVTKLKTFSARKKWFYCTKNLDRNSGWKKCSPSSKEEGERRIFSLYYIQESQEFEHQKEDENRLTFIHPPFEPHVAERWTEPDIKIIFFPLFLLKIFEFLHCAKKRSKTAVPFQGRVMWHRKQNEKNFMSGRKYIS